MESTGPVSIFEEDLKFSEDATTEQIIKEILLKYIPGAIEVKKAEKWQDKQGTDYWVHCGTKRPPLSIDAKVRSVDPVEEMNKGKMGFKDDLALETWSKIGTQVGWTRDRKKRTDYILWFFESTRRWALVPFIMLCGVFEKYWEEWKGIYKVKTHTCRGDLDTWESECVFVPRQVIWDKMQEMYG